MTAPIELLVGDCRRVLAGFKPGSVFSAVTSPPYFHLRDYGVEGQIGLEATVGEYVEALVEVFRAVRRVLHDEGTLWINLGDTYAVGGGRSGAHSSLAKAGANSPEAMKAALARRAAAQADRPRMAAFEGLKKKDLIGIPWRVALALQADGWYLRQDLVWHKLNVTPESARDRCTRSHEYVFLLSKSPSYHFDARAIAEPVQSDRAPARKAKRSGAGHAALRGETTPYDGRGETRLRRSVWSLPTQPFKGAHFACMPARLAELCILAGTPEGERVLDPFAGAGTTGLAEAALGRSARLIELNPEYAAIAERRLLERGIPIEVREVVS